MAHAINWFEIPAKDIGRAKTFYETILGVLLQTFDGMGMKSAFFPADMENGSVGGCLVEGEGYEPSATGSLVYLNGGDDLNTVLSRVEGAGGKIIMPKTSIGEYGFAAYFEDSEGNKIGLHSTK